MTLMKLNFEVTIGDTLSCVSIVTNNKIISKIIEIESNIIVKSFSKRSVNKKKPIQSIKYKEILIHHIHFLYLYITYNFYKYEVSHDLYIFFHNLTISTCNHMLYECYKK